MTQPVVTACACTGEPKSILDEQGQQMLVEGRAVCPRCGRNPFGEPVPQVLSDDKPSQRDEAWEVFRRTQHMHWSNKTERWEIWFDAWEMCLLTKVRQAFNAGYVAGWEASGEGWNGEHPPRDVPKTDESWQEQQSADWRAYAGVDADSHGGECG